ncbi:MAG: hypothetical protein H0X65_11465 [Gemmatimonadetes bacterium]|nr:hypothetical protein [Gemmatimonadota bacterium]
MESIGGERPGRMVSCRMRQTEEICPFCGGHDRIASVEPGSLLARPV